MNKGMWKRNLRRGAALALTLVMSLSIAARGAAQGLAAQAAGNAGVAGVTAMKPYPIPGGHTSIMTRLSWNRPWLTLNRPVLLKAGMRKC